MSKLTESDFSEKTVVKLNNDEISSNVEEKLNDMYNTITNIDCKLKSETELKDKLVKLLQELEIDIDTDVDLYTIFNIISNLKTVVNCTATAEDVLKDKTITDLNGELVHGVIDVYEDFNIDFSNGNQTIFKGYYPDGITVVGDENLISSNIRKGVSIFGITGTAEFADVISTSNNSIYGWSTTIDVYGSTPNTLYEWTCPYQGQLYIYVSAAAYYEYAEWANVYLNCYKNNN
jgi:hypothetical protein